MRKQPCEHCGHPTSCTDYADQEPPVRWNMTERAARAEALAERLAAALQQTEDRLSAWEDGARMAAKAADRRRDLSEETAHMNRAENYAVLVKTSRAALDAWAAHRADLDTLENSNLP